VIPQIGWRRIGWCRVECEIFFAFVAHWSR
jgi:hypothetical protein